VQFFAGRDEAVVSVRLGYASG